jgi:hypothetical protein
MSTLLSKSISIMIFSALAGLTSLAHAAQLNPSQALEKLVPHKALYEIEMVAKHSGSQVLNISGQMFFEWKPTCEAWISDHRFNLFYEYADSPSMRITSDFTTYETFDGTQFDYSSRRKRNGELYQEIRGTASMSDERGAAMYSIPSELDFELKKGTLFPMAHTVNVLEHILNGKNFYHATVFDGSDEDGPVEINTFIGKNVNAMANIKPSPELDTSLLNTPAWNVRMAFFPLMAKSAESDYEMSVAFHENGIISDMLIEYKDFSVSQKLVALEELEGEKCEH